MIKIKIKRLNPTDHKLISELKIVKTRPGYGTKYSVYHGNKRIGFASIDEDQEENTITDVDVIKDYRRKGVSNFLYDYIEKDLGVKLKPSNCLLDDGEAFWQGRLKRKNPTDHKLISELHIVKGVTPFGFSYEAYYKDKKIGVIRIDRRDDHIAFAWVHKPFQRKGISTFLYNYVEKDLKIIIKPSSNLSEEGEEFWKARLKK